MVLEVQVGKAFIGAMGYGAIRYGRAYIEKKEAFDIFKFTRALALGVVVGIVVDFAHYPMDEATYMGATFIADQIAMAVYNKFKTQIDSIAAILKGIIGK